MPTEQTGQPLAEGLSEAAQTVIRLPVRQVVEMLLRSGDIDSRFAEKDRMLEGSKAHRMLQKRNAAADAEYRSEITLAGECDCRGLRFRLEGRADGIYTENGVIFVDEIKTTVLPLDGIDEEFSQTHWAQARCYAFILARQNGLSEIGIRLTYYNLDTGDRKDLRRMETAESLEAFVNDLLGRYAVWAEFSSEWEVLRDASAKALTFPFPAFRAGQREFAAAAYRAIAAKKKLFAQAPTGTGKTISTLFPAVKALGEGKTSKIFYLTAKTITRQAAEEAFEKMRAGGLRLKTLTLTAKEKICFCEKPACNPDQCEVARGHYDRVGDAILEAVRQFDGITRGVVEEIARRHRVCPFELSLDISLWVDCVVCDYNYVFDPRAYLRRFFADGGSDYVFLVDEAHNLGDRAREMFSATLVKSHFYAIKKELKGKDRALDRVLTKINAQMLELRRRCGEAGLAVTAEQPKELLALITKLIAVCETLLKEHRELGENNGFLQLYFEALNYALIAELYDERFVSFAEAEGGEVTARLFCLDPSVLLAEAFQRGGSAVLFSATLTPLAYFRELLGGSKEDGLLAVSSPFDPGRLCLLAADYVSTRFKHREQSVGRVAELIHTFVGGKTGNYLVFFPSYKYMHDVYDAFTGRFPDIAAVEQENAMPEEERERFLEAFREEPGQTFVAFCVLGGIFSEGIDLKGSRLIGTVIVGVGLPQINPQQDEIRGYFSRKNGMGYEFAYQYPGMNKVLQAAGRVIRTETDCGAVLLIDERYGTAGYRRLFPAHWRHCRFIRTDEQLSRAVRAFWAGENAAQAQLPGP